MTLDEAVAYALEPEPAGPADAPAALAHHGPKPTPTAGPAASGLPPLTQREIQVLRLVAAGLTAPQVAARLYLSVRTVENHLRSIYGKLNVSTRAAATRFALEHGLLRD